MPRILVTGSNGLLGQKLVTRLLCDPSVEPVFSARSPLVLDKGRGQFIQLDITDRDRLKEVMETYLPDVVINTAAMTNVDQCEIEQDDCRLINVTAVGHLIDACASLGTHLIQVSTDFIFDGSEGPLDETAVPSPVNFYGASKLDAEQMIQASNISWSILRTVLVYGVTPDMSRSNIVLWVRKSLMEGKSINVVNDQWRTPTLAEDLAEGCYLAGIKKSKGVYHISGQDMITPYEMAIEVADSFGLDRSLISSTDSTRFKQTAQRPLKTGFIIDKAKKDLGYAPHSFKEGLAIVADQLSSLS